MKPKPSENPLAFVQGMLGSLYANPQGYVQTVGELSALLWFVHHLWAGIANRQSEFVDTRCGIYDQEFAGVAEGISGHSVADLESRRVVVELWKRIDQAMNIDTDPEQYDNGTNSN